MKIALLALFVFLAAPRSHGQPAFNLDAANKDLVSMLVDFVKIDTSLTETPGAQFLKTFLDKEGIQSEVLELEPGRGNLVARLKGNGSKKPLLLLGHTDVVGVEREKWTVDPFGGVIKDGYLYGRGSRDDKAMTAANLIVFIALHRLKVPLDRDIIYVAEAGEEGAPYYGIEFLVKKHWDKIECELALNEGGGVLEKNGKPQLLRVATSEKVPRPLMITAKGVSGHGSRPRPDNAIVHLAMAIAKIGNWQSSMRLNETTREYFKRLATISPPEDALAYARLEDPAHTEAVQERFRLSELGHNSMVRTTISPNIIRGGFRSNVIPGDANATLDVRALPDEDMTSFTNTLAQLINDPAVTITSLGGSRPATPPSPLDSVVFRAAEKIQKTVYPDAITVPFMTPGATDSAQLRAKGVQAYGIGVGGTDEDGATIHGNDERISLQSLRQFLDFLWGLVNEIAATK